MRRERAVRGNRMNVWMVVNQFAERLDTGNHAGCHIVAVKHLAVDFDDRQPGSPGQFPKQLAVQSAVNP